MRMFSCLLIYCQNFSSDILLDVFFLCFKVKCLPIHYFIYVVVYVTGAFDSHKLVHSIGPEISSGQSIKQEWCDHFLTDDHSVQGTSK